MALYTNMALKATQGSAPFKYLRVTTTNKSGYLEYEANQVTELGTKFAIETAPGNLVHIRSCTNNKYWVRSITENDLIVARAVEPVVDQKSPNCTLFSIRMDNNNKTTSFLHVQSGRVVGFHVGNGGRMLSVAPSATTQAVSGVVDHDALVILPKLVAFRGSNGLYYNNNTQTLSGTEIGHPDIVCEPQYTSDGHLRLRIVSAIEGSENLFWGIANHDNSFPKFIWRFNNDPTDVKQMFDVIKVNRNVIALRSRYNNTICKKDDFATGKNLLIANSIGLVKDAHLDIVEPVLNRRVTVVEFDLDRARIYGTELLYSDDHIWDNPTDTPAEGSANGLISTTKTRTYTHNVTVSASVTTIFETSIPFIAKGEIQVSASASYSHEWSHAIEETQQVGHVFNVAVLPRKRTIARGTATKAKCDVPFAYIQRDYPSNGGPPIITRLNDGVFTGANAYSFHSEVLYVDLPTYNGPAPTKIIKSVVPHKYK